MNEMYCLQILDHSFGSICYAVSNGTRELHLKWHRLSTFLYQLHVLSSKIASQPIIMISERKVLKTCLITCHIRSSRSTTELINYPAGRDILLLFNSTVGSVLGSLISRSSFPKQTAVRSLFSHVTSSQFHSIQSQTQRMQFLLSERSVFLTYESPILYEST